MLQLWNWLTEIPTGVWSLLGNLISSLIVGGLTLVGVLLGQHVIQRRQERKQEADVRSLRESIIAELRTHDEGLESVLYTAFDPQKMQERRYSLSEELYEEAFENERQAKLSILLASADNFLFSRTVYESNTGMIGELDSKTARLVIRTYDGTARVTRHLENLRNAVTHKELGIGEDIDWSTGGGLPPEVLIEAGQIESAIAGTVLIQKATLARLGDELSKSDRAAIVFAFTNLNPDSEEYARYQQLMKLYMEKSNAASVEEFIDFLDEDEDESSTGESEME